MNAMFLHGTCSTDLSNICMLHMYRFLPISWISSTPLSPCGDGMSLVVHKVDGFNMLVPVFRCNA